jgi:hypothetical protein
LTAIRQRHHEEGKASLRSGRKLWNACPDSPGPDGRLSWNAHLNINQAKKSIQLLEKAYTDVTALRNEAKDIQVRLLSDGILDEIVTLIDMLHRMEDDPKLKRIIGEKIVQTSSSIEQIKKRA